MPAPPPATPSARGRGAGDSLLRIWSAAADPERGRARPAGRAVRLAPPGPWQATAARERWTVAGCGGRVCLLPGPCASRSGAARAHGV